MKIVAKRLPAIRIAKARPGLRGDFGIGLIITLRVHHRQ
jgi:hypothetical protein